MESEITDIIARLVVNHTPELPARLDYQAEALRDALCTNPVLGHWIDDYDVKYLLASLNLSDEDFARKFPAMANISSDQRQRIVNSFEDHLGYCQHCALKTGYDLELDDRIKQICQQNHGFLIQLLEEEEAELSDEGDHGDLSLENVVWALS